MTFNMRNMRAARGLVVAVLLAAGGAACAKARAETTVLEGPPLQVPAPPSRVLVPVEELVSTPLVSEPEPAPVPVTPRTPPRPAAEAKPQPAPAPVVAPPQPVAEPRDLRTASPTTNTDSERSVREVLARAARDIVRVEYSRLSADGRAQYDQSKRFSAQAEQALKERNLIFAATLADKAATLAAELLGR
jgi:outer membrane biosynthesis protein TonB